MIRNLLETITAPVEHAGRYADMQSFQQVRNIRNAAIDKNELEPTRVIVRLHDHTPRLHVLTVRITPRRRPAGSLATVRGNASGLITSPLKRKDPHLTA